MSQPGAREVARADLHHLRFRGEAAQRRTVQDPRAIALEVRAARALGRLGRPALGVMRTVGHSPSVAAFTRYRGTTRLKPRDRDAERGAGHIVEAGLVEEPDRRGVAAVLAAHAEVQVRA